uniref:ABC-2 type transport system ATP-binding protein n=1 Tax=Candidatus Kentrum sp. FW TaxID=2126338 RepID=A0A450TFY4_9GAMM|nr:MAG: ABC-2 type transport system ATP-binding protein [Candidatus Kentron sp. FW]
MKANREAPMLEALGLTKEFDGVRAVDRLDLSIGPGEVYGLLGPNGAGKTTTINLFLGFLRPTIGAARVCGLDVQHSPLETKRQLAFIPEQVTLYRNLSGLENLAYFTALAGQRNTDNAALRRFLNEAGLQGEAHDRRVGTYSKGMRQKVGIALALAKKASVLLLDEPTSGLDPAASFEFSELLRHLSGSGVAVLMATHDLFRAKDVATRVGLMQDGRLVLELTGEELVHADLEAIYLDHMRGTASGGLRKEAA